MLQHFLVVTLRNLRRDIGYSLINILGLGVGIAVSLLLFFWVRYELSYDRFHIDAERIYQIAFSFPGEVMTRLCGIRSSFSRMTCTGRPASTVKNV